MFMNEIADIYCWLKWQVIWFGQRLTRHLMPSTGLRVGFRFGNFKVKKIGWHQWGYYWLRPKVVFSDGQRLREWYYEQFCWITTERFVESCAFHSGLPENCVWVVEEQDLT
jgi:hypothetical protein